MHFPSKAALAVLLSAVGSLPSFASPAGEFTVNLAGTSGLHAQVIVAAPGPVGWYRGRYWDGNRYWARREWYAAHPGWNGGWGPGWHYAPGPVAVAPAGPGIAVGWYNGRYYDGHRYWAQNEWYAAHPGWRGGWGPGWHYRP